MDELERRLRGEHDAMRDAVPQSGPDVYGAVKAGARRRRVVRGTLTGSVAAVAAGVLGIGAWGLVSTDRAAQPAAPLPSASPTPAVSDSPSAEPSPMASVEPVNPRFDDSPDGIAEDALPALAADRGYLREPGYRHEDDEGLAYPSARVMEDWVWEAVGEDWTLDVVAVQQDYYNPDFVQPAAVMYLVSPEDVTFELFELPERAWDDARVVSWREDQGVAMVWWSSTDDGQPRTGHGAAVDLSTGELDDLAFGVYGESADDTRFIMANAQGDELWRAESEAGFKYYRWSQGADEDGWVASALVEAAPDADHAAASIGLSMPTTTADGDTVLLRSGGPSGSTASNVTVSTYTLSADAVTTYTFTQYPGSAELMDALFLGADAFEATLRYQEDSFDPEAPWSSYRKRFALDGSGSVADVGEGAETWLEWPGPRVGVTFGEASSAAVASEDCGC